MKRKFYQAVATITVMVAAVFSLGTAPSQASETHYRVNAHLGNAYCSSGVWTAYDVVVRNTRNRAVWVTVHMYSHTKPGTAITPSGRWDNYYNDTRKVAAHSTNGYQLTIPGQGWGQVDVWRGRGTSGRLMLDTRRHSILCGNPAPAQPVR